MKGVDMRIETTHDRRCSTVIWDVGGTLVDRVVRPIEAVARALGVVGLRLDAIDAATLERARQQYLRTVPQAGCRLLSPRAGAGRSGGLHGGVHRERPGARYRSSAGGGAGDGPLRPTPAARGGRRARRPHAATASASAGSTQIEGSAAV